MFWPNYLVLNQAVTHVTGCELFLAIHYYTSTFPQHFQNPRALLFSRKWSAALCWLSRYWKPENFPSDFRLSLLGLNVEGDFIHQYIYVRLSTFSLEFKQFPTFKLVGHIQRKSDWEGRKQHRLVQLGKPGPHSISLAYRDYKMIFRGLQFPSPTFVNTTTVKNIYSNIRYILNLTVKMQRFPILESHLTTVTPSSEYTHLQHHRSTEVSTPQQARSDLQTQVRCPTSTPKPGLWTAPKGSVTHVASLPGHTTTQNYMLNTTSPWTVQEASLKFATSASTNSGNPPLPWVRRPLVNRTCQLITLILGGMCKCVIFFFLVTSNP